MHTFDRKTDTFLITSPHWHSMQRGKNLLSLYCTLLLNKKTMYICIMCGGRCLNWRCLSNCTPVSATASLRWLKLTHKLWAAVTNCGRLLMRMLTDHWLWQRCRCQRRQVYSQQWNSSWRRHSVIWRSPSSIAGSRRGCSHAVVCISVWYLSALLLWFCLHRFCNF